MADGQYVDGDMRPVVVLRRPDQPVDYSQVKGVILKGEPVWLEAGTTR